MGTWVENSEISRVSCDSTYPKPVGVGGALVGTSAVVLGKGLSALKSPKKANLLYMANDKHLRPDRPALLDRLYTAVDHAMQQLSAEVELKSAA